MEHDLLELSIIFLPPNEVMYLDKRVIYGAVSHLIKTHEKAPPSLPSVLSFFPLLMFPVVMKEYPFLVSGFRMSQRSMTRESGIE